MGFRFFEGALLGGEDLCRISAGRRICGGDFRFSLPFLEGDSFSVLWEEDLNRFFSFLARGISEYFTFFKGRKLFFLWRARGGVDF